MFSHGGHGGHGGHGHQGGHGLCVKTTSVYPKSPRWPKTKHRRCRGVRSKTTPAAYRMGKMLGPGLGNCSILFAPACASSTVYTCLCVCVCVPCFIFGIVWLHQGFILLEKSTALRAACCMLRLLIHSYPHEYAHSATAEACSTCQRSYSASLVLIKKRL